VPNEDETVFLTLAGYNETIPARAFAQALKTFLGLLEDMDATLTGNKRGTLNWEVVVLSKNSPARIGLIGRPRPRKENKSRQIAFQCVRGIQRLSEKPEGDANYSDSALEKTLRLASLTEKQFAEIDIKSANDEVSVT
jgi:hypothetical protein